MDIRVENIHHVRTIYSTLYSSFITKDMKAEKRDSKNWVGAKLGSFKMDPATKWSLLVPKAPITAQGGGLTLVTLLDSDGRLKCMATR